MHRPTDQRGPQQRERQGELRLDVVLQGLLPRMRREFPLIRDEATWSELLDETARRLAAREARAGPIERLHAYAWVAFRSVAISRMRSRSSQVDARLVSAEYGDHLLEVVPSRLEAAEQIEQRVLLRQLLNHLSREERRIILLKHAGHSSYYIARRCGRTPEAVDVIVFRARMKLRRIAGVLDERDEER